MSQTIDPNKYKQLLREFRSINEFELREQIKNRGLKTVEEKLEEYDDLMSLLIRLSPTESARTFKQRMRGLLDYQTSILKFERRQCGKENS